MRKLTVIKPQLTLAQAKKILAKHIISNQGKGILESIKAEAVKIISSEEENTTTKKPADTEISNVKLTFDSVDLSGTCPCANCINSNHLPGLKVLTSHLS